MEKAVISAGRIVTIPYSGKLFSLHLDGLLTQELCDDLTDSEDWEYVWESLVSCLGKCSNATASETDTAHTIHWPLIREQTC